MDSEGQELWTRNLLIRIVIGVIGILVAFITWMSLSLLNIRDENIRQESRIERNAAFDVRIKAIEERLLYTERQFEGRLSKNEERLWKLEHFMQQIEPNKFPKQGEYKDDPELRFYPRSYRIHLLPRDFFEGLSL